MSHHWKLLPIEPTREMLNGVCMHPDLARALWEGLLKNAPQPPALGDSAQTLAKLTLGGLFDHNELGDNDIELETANVEALQLQLVKGFDDVHVDLVSRAHITQLHAEIASLRVDAERYRWLRAQTRVTGPMAVATFPGEPSKMGDACLSGKQLDEQIDAARSVSVVSDQE